MEKIKILWADDEIDLLKPHILFLEKKGYYVKGIYNGNDLIDEIKSNHYDLIFLDEHMPGVSGLELLMEIQNIHPNLPVIMITKSEEESIMEDAIGSKISDYLIKPVNPKQILSSIKKILNKKELIFQKTTIEYQKDFRELSMLINDNLNADEWKELYKKLIFWDLRIQAAAIKEMSEILLNQKIEANNLFCRFYERNYKNWLHNPSKDTPVMSHRLIKKKILPKINDDFPVFLILIDNFRYDQWEILRPVIEEYFKIINEDSYFSILPTATQYARNSIFAGLLPLEISEIYPNLWVGEHDEEGKNIHEKELLEKLFLRYGKSIRFSYNKITKINDGKKLLENIKNLFTNDLNVIVYNFVDMLSHARTEMEIIKELADNEAAYRSLTFSWFQHSPLFEILKEIHKIESKIIITTDHGTVQVKHPVKIIGDRNTSTNLRYKQGRNLNYNSKNVFEITKPEVYHLPKDNISTRYVFARSYDYFVYPNNYNYYVNYFKNTFQHGGISLEEIIIPFIELEPRR